MKVRRRYVYTDRPFPKAKMGHGRTVRIRRGVFGKKSGEFIPYGARTYINYEKPHFYSKRKTVRRSSWGYG